VCYQPARQTLFCSKIFKWYRPDFLTVADSIVDYIKLYDTGIQPPSMTKVAYLPYSWQLNQRTSA